MKKRISVLVLIIAVLFCNALSVSAYSYSDIAQGSYYVDATLSCYVNAMGGVEFGSPLLIETKLNVDESMKKTLTLSFTKSQVTIYSVTCDTFIDASPSYESETNGIKSGTLGFYDENGVLNTSDIEYTLSDDTALNAQQEQVHYVKTLTFPVDFESDTYNLTLFVNSNVMGTQFTADGYPATLSVDWASLSADEIVTEAATTPATSAQNSVSNDDVEVKDGLNIHRADEGGKETEAVAEAVTNGSKTYIAYFKEPLLIGVGIIAVAVILTGSLLVILGRKEKSDEKT